MELGKEGEGEGGTGSVESPSPKELPIGYCCTCGGRTGLGCERVSNGIPGEGQMLFQVPCKATPPAAFRAILVS